MCSRFRLFLYLFVFFCYCMLLFVIACRFLLLHVVVCYCMLFFVIALCCLLLHVVFCYCMLLFVIACCCLFRGSGIERYKLIKHFLKSIHVHVRTNGRIARSYTFVLLRRHNLRPVYAHSADLCN